MDQRFVTANSLWDGIVLWELQEQKCQQRVTVSVFKCGTKFPGWLDGAHPTVKDGEVYGKVYFSDHFKGCHHTIQISVKNCSSYHIYKL